MSFRGDNRDSLGGKMMDMVLNILLSVQLNDVSKVATPKKTSSKSAMSVTKANRAGSIVSTYHYLTSIFNVLYVAIWGNLKEEEEYESYSTASILEDSRTRKFDLSPTHSLSSRPGKHVTPPVRCTLASSTPTLSKGRIKGATAIESPVCSLPKSPIATPFDT
eukprot:CFRG7804T1